jgi:2-C-methyl-D-erythritol 4-phosphate cytidylyltransferase/2-C-methyl-D-erythritol 2,4-cyclodiphosphate synthase
MKIIALVTAAGTGERFGGELPKQYMPLAGKAMLMHSLETFVNHPKVTHVAAIISQEHVDLYEKATAGLELLPYIIGGKERQESVLRGLEGVENEQADIVLIHDAARPFVTDRVIDDVISAVESGKAVIPAIIVEDTLKKVENGKILHTVSRSDLYRAQTPQAFKYKDILAAHRQLKEQVLTDDAGLFEYLGLEITICKGSQINFKITSFDDYLRAERQMSKKETRVGFGYDVHRFIESSVEDNKIMLCGVAVPFEREIVAHSDGDVAFHALVDGLLGAIGEGDIGRHFPPSDERFKDMSSQNFLEKCLDLLRAKNAVINNIDITIICEQPKITPFAAQMITRTAEILQITEDRINIKATTTEKLGFLGRGEGIAANAVVAVKV